MKIKKNIYWPIWAALLIFAGVWIGMAVGQKNKNGSQKNSISKLNKLIEYLERDYMTSVNTDSIVDLTVNEILSKLDPHSVYIPANQIDEINQSMQGKFVGIGISFLKLRDTVTVIKTINNGPSEKAGIKTGDRILFADNKPLFGSDVSNQDIYGLLKGSKKSKVNLKVLRKSENKLLNFVVQRDEVPVVSVESAFFIDDNTAFFKINRFAETTHEEFKTHFLRLKNLNPIKNVVIDLRDNTGGYMDKAIKIADEFLSNNQVIVSTVTKNGQKEDIKAQNKGLFTQGGLAILINENSASASEILAGAIQDNDRGYIVGRRSFGKGLVQKDLALGDGSAVRLTIAKYLTPSGRSIQKPYNNLSKSAYFNDFEQRFEQGELYEKDAIKVSDSLKFKTKKGRIVYGGGGIVPDVFVGLPQGKDKNDLWMQSHTGFLDNLAFFVIDNHPKDFENITLTNLENLLKTKQYYLQDVVTYLDNIGINQDFWNPNDSSKLELFKQSFINQLFGIDAYYQYTAKKDEMILKALEQFNMPIN